MTKKTIEREVRAWRGARSDESSGKSLQRERALAQQPWSLQVQYACADAVLPSRADVRRWVRATRPGTAELVVRFVDAVEGRALNARFRGKAHATNVLSFSYAPPPTLAGDLVLCVPVIRREAQAQAKPPLAHFAHLIVHGMLHLQGYEHESAGQARVMENKEREVLARLGYPDPYASEESR